DLPGHLHEGRLLVGALELHAEALGRRLHPVEAADEVDVPPVAPELAVRHRLQADRLLKGDGAADAAILHRAQRGPVDLAARRAGARLVQLGWTQQAADVVRTEWGSCDGAHHSPPSTRQLPGQGVRRSARIGAGRHHARFRIASGHDGADAAGADLADGVAERAELGARALRNTGLDVELPGSIGAGIERVDERLGREARRLDRLL